MIAREKQGHPEADKKLGSILHTDRTPVGSQPLWQHPAGWAESWGVLGAEPVVTGDGGGR